MDRFINQASRLETCSYDGPNVCSGTQVQLLLTIVTALANKRNFKQFCDKPKNLLSEYDFIVVGGGLAGPVVAARLSEIEKFNVLLIEAGPEEPLTALVPGMSSSIINTEVDWNHTTVNEQNACRKTGGKCAWPRGKNLAGTAAHHGMMYVRGVPEDFNRWNLSDWTWDNVLPYFNRSENQVEFKNKYHGTGGPLLLNRFPDHPNLAEDILLAAEQAGYGVSEDLNGEKGTGFTIAQTNNDKGVRVSTATAFLRPVRERKNLHVLLRAEVSKLIFSKKDPLKVIGVEYYKNNKREVVRAKKEVILSAGTINTPQILLLSGIGPKEEILSKKIKLVKNLPGVGNNVQNHVSYTLVFEIDEPASDLFEESAKQYIENQTGPLSGTGLTQMTGILPSSKTTSAYPDIQFYFRGYNSSCSGQKSGKQQISIVGVYLHTKSRGTIKLASKKYTDRPIITQNYLTEDEDWKGIIEAVRIALKLTQADALKKHNITLVSDPIPECEPNINSDDYWECAIKYNTDPENHQVGSCKMGPSTDPDRVVDSELKVIGIKGLRVADASVIPLLTSGNIAAPIIMVAERAADFIKKDYARPKIPYVNLFPKYPSINTKLPITNPKLYPYPPYLYTDES